MAVERPPRERNRPHVEVDVDLDPTLTTPGGGGGSPLAATDRTTMLGQRAEGALPSVGQLGRYVVAHKLGEGGMGVVYIGYDAALDRRVALKVLRHHLPAKEWLFREGQALAKLAHPHVGGVHEVGEQDGSVFLAMELVEGPTLRVWLEERRHSVGSIVRMFLQAGRGLAAAHEVGLVHRDFKPDNVLIGKDGRARVVDFGIAALAASDQAATSLPSGGPPVGLLRSQPTGEGGIMGTPGFMSPEQFRAQRATPSSDQWSFCVSLYRAIYGAPPFAGQDLVQLRRSVLHDTPAPQSSDDAPSWLAPIILRGLQRDPANRFASMNELLAAIESHLPRDPEMDPSFVARDREILSGTWLILMTVYCLLFLSSAVANLLMTPVALIAAPAGMLAGMSGVVAARWRSLSRNRYGRRLAGIFPCTFLMQLLSHIVGVRLGLRPQFILVQDLLVIAALSAPLALTIDAWVGVSATMVGGTALVVSGLPEYAPLAIGLAGVLGAVAMLTAMFMDRNAASEVPSTEEETTAPPP